MFVLDACMYWYIYVCYVYVFCFLFSFPVVFMYSFVMLMFWLLRFEGMANCDFSDDVQ